MSNSGNHKVTTLCLVHDTDRVLLAMKKRGFGAGKWNGFGGKVQAGESIEEATVRETEEESLIRVRNLRKCGVLHFSFEGEALTIECHVFRTDVWDGTPTETEEMRPAWFDRTDIPFSEMWSDDVYWFPLFFARTPFAGTFHFAADHKTILRQEIAVQTQTALPA